MPREMQTLFNNLIPEYRNSLNQDFWQQIESIWNSGSKVLNLPSFRSFVGNKLGDTGTGLLTFMDARERLINRGSDWRNLSDIFILNDSTQGSGNILNTPWSQLSENIYARFITEGNAGDTGFLLLRIKETPQQTKALPLLAIAGAALTVYELYDLISTLMALPEGNANIQPLAMSIAEDFAIDTATDRATDRACQAIKPRGRITGLLSILCNVGTRRPGKPGRGKNPEKIASGNNRGVNSGNNIKKPDSRPNQQLKSVHRVQKPGNQLPPNKKYLSDASVPSHYRQDSRFNNLASDPDQGFKTTPKTRAEAIAGLEAETQNLVSKPIKRGPKGIEFYDADGNPWDVKTPTSPSPGESWKFDSKDAVTAIKKELRDKTQLLSDGTKTPPGTFLNGNTVQPVPRKVILDSSYMNPADHQALWQRLNQELTPDELNRIVEIVNLP